MTEKRYSHDGVVIIDHLKKDLIHIDGKEGLLELAEYVDKLQDENEQLRKENDMLSCELSVSANKEISRNCRIAELEEEKEKVFTWIDKEIARNEEAIKWGKETGADSSAMGFYNHMLKRLKKELKE